jgi:hypothetical protein
LLDLFFDHEDASDMLLRNVECLSTDYTVSYPRRQYSSGCSLDLFFDPEDVGDMLLRNVE